MFTTLNSAIKHVCSDFFFHIYVNSTGAGSIGKNSVFFVFFFVDWEKFQERSLSIFEYCLRTHEHFWQALRFGVMKRTKQKVWLCVCFKMIG